MLEVKHFVKQNVFDRVLRHARTVEDAADDDGVVSGVVVAEAAPGVVLAPGKLRTSHESVEETAVEVVKDFFQVVMVAAWGAHLLASAHLADEPGFRSNVVTGDIASIPAVVDAIDGLAIKLGEKDVGDRMEYGVGRAFEQIGEANVEFSFAKADGVVNGDERIKTNVHGRRERARAKVAVGFVKDFGELWGHVEGRLARELVVEIQLPLQSFGVHSVWAACGRDDESGSVLKQCGLHLFGARVSRTA